MAERPSIDFGPQSAPRQHHASGAQPRLRPGKGLDVGTANLLSAVQDFEGNVIIKAQRNAFTDIEQNDFTRNMLTKMDVQYVVLNNRMVVIGDPAFDLANIYNRETRRPMSDGMISPKEADALPIEKLLIDRLLGPPQVQNEVVYYSVPAEPIDFDMNVVYHKGIFNDLLRKLGYNPKDIIEGHCVVFAELDEDDFTGVGISCGGGMFNICVAYKSMPALYFSTARSGDWVDKNVANVLGIKPAKAALLKEKGVDLMKPKNREEDAISIYYRNLIKYNVTNIAERFRAAENMPSFGDPISVVFSGGTSMAINFIELVKAVFKEIDFPIPVKDVWMAKDPFNATAKGALVAAQLEMSSQEQTA
jgi:hypothetical protein